MSTTVAGADEVIDLAVTESAAARRQRWSTGGLITALGVVMAVLATSTQGEARFALSGYFDAVQLPEVSVPGLPIVIAAAVVCLVAGAVLLVIGARLPGWVKGLIGAVAGLFVVVGFLGWAVAGRDLPFQLSGQFAGTLAVATPLVLGAMCGVLCERSGVVNVAIEGQFLMAAFAASLIGSITQSIPLALLAAVIASVLTSGLLAAFAMKFLVNQVVLGVVINLLASGITGFLFDQLVAPRAGDLNSAPLLQPISIPLLHRIPFLGPVLFEQTILAYLAGIAVVVVWWLIFGTGWGLKVRAVGEHPEAADTVGINVLAMRWQAVLLGGVFAGLGGAMFTIGQTGAFIKDITVGSGFIALAALIMGRWHPGWAALMAVFFGFVTQLAQQLQSLSTPVPSQFLLILPYIATIIAVAGLIGRVRAPAADGVPYQKAG
ncbi:MAG TPA: ABC transporter permease [Candidatus Avipropionibacterium avicola]|uniref:ABC transporter permease n=1 Tax=Candidatus Avipropionibacterium avicola TaxID=2840701 RepID=A0A9D1KNU1_9ACTN|nr:ABC transporter permease [Candidatus Avipropionibacterium avicola]